MYTMPEILMLVAAIGVVLNSAIQQWRQGVKIEQTLVKTAVIEGHVNSRETKYVEELASVKRENALLQKVITDKDATAALLAQAVVGRTRSAPSEHEGSSPTLDNIEVNTAATAKNTAKTDAAVTKLRKRR